ncbi:lysozyme [Methylorubrum sp. DB1722]|uniref:lysozyme n=1 Tax=Methylorubrum sp. DB1722 TaxID=2478916 RepID=UPI0018E3C7E5|nr:lysozyme [Methylorubrum sp. DB1722]MBI1689512.1 lysozyme [Methylorubrum sp. DB1722]
MLALLRKLGVALAVGTAKAAPRAVAPVPVAVTRTAAKPGSRLKRSAAAAALCTSLVGGFEGLRTAAYPDPATGREPWTVCYGETAGVKRGDVYTVAQCKEMLAKSLEGYALRMEACVTRPMADETYAAFLSLSYNIGSGGFCKSSVVRLWNAGETRAACDAMLKFNRAAGVVMPGLTRRRTQERALCLKGA